MKLYQYSFSDYLIKIKIKEQDVEIYLTDGENLWHSSQTIESSVPQLSFLKKFKVNLEEVLKYEDREKYEFKFDEEKMLLYIMLVEKKKYIISTFSFDKVQDKKQVMRMLTYYINKVSKLEEENQKLQEIADKKEKADEVAKQAVQERLNQENLLLTSFIHILNEKRNKIQLLESELENCVHPKPKRTPLK